jgi:hypothetical protein
MGGVFSKLTITHSLSLGREESGVRGHTALDWPLSTTFLLNTHRSRSQMILALRLNGKIKMKFILFLNEPPLRLSRETRGDVHSQPESSYEY